MVVLLQAVGVGQAPVHAAHHLDLLHVAALARWHILLLLLHWTLFARERSRLICFLLPQRAHLRREIHVRHFLPSSQVVNRSQALRLQG